MGCAVSILEGFKSLSGRGPELPGQHHSSPCFEQEVGLETAEVSSSHLSYSAGLFMVRGPLFITTLGDFHHV